MAEMTTQTDVQMTFAEAYKRLEQIYQTCMSSEMLDVEKMVALQDEAKRCYDLCHSTLLKTQAQLQESSTAGERAA